MEKEEDVSGEAVLKALKAHLKKGADGKEATDIKEQIRMALKRVSCSVAQESRRRIVAPRTEVEKT